MNIQLQRLWDNMDKLILVFLLIVTISVHVHMVGALGNSIDPGEANQINWLENIIGQLLAALLTLLVTQIRKAPTPTEGDKVEKA